MAAATAAPEAWSPGPTLRPVLDELLGDDNRLDIAPGLLPQLTTADADASQLVGGGWSGEGRRLRYWDHHAPRRVLGVRVVVALAEVPPGAGGLTLLPASHKSTLAPPLSVLQDPEASIAAPLLDQPALFAGDALICAGSLARGLWPWRAPTPQLLLGATFASNRAFPTAGYDVPPDAPPAWLDELTPVRQRLKPGREQGTGRDQVFGHRSNSRSRRLGSPAWAAPTTAGVTSGRCRGSRGSGVSTRRSSGFGTCAACEACRDD